jgi:2-oxoglutarate dehydrogenase E1 component
VYYDLVAGREAQKADNVAIVRIEQMYPFPQAQLEAILARFAPATEVYWVQEEPRNMGPWRFMHDSFPAVLHHSRRVLHYAGRPEYASPAAGTLKRHEQEQAEIVHDAFAPMPVRRAPKRVRLVRKK